MTPDEITPGNRPLDTEEYERLAQEEIEHYNRIFLEDQSEHGRQARETLQQPVPPTWIEIENRAAALIRAKTGNDLLGHVLAKLRSAPNLRMLSLGSGPGGIEVSLAQQAPGAHFTCIDLNPNLVQLGNERAAELALPMEFATGDLNTITLEQNAFDVVFCHASLHHVIELERLAQQIRGALRTGGELMTVDVSTRNGYLMFDRTRPIVRDLFRTLPPRFRINHTAYNAAKVDEEIWEMDTSESSMECIRSADIIPTLAATFTTREYVPYFSISRRFLDTMYGPNYDLERTLDQALIQWIWELDCYYTQSGWLEPETFFGIYSK